MNLITEPTSEVATAAGELALVIQVLPDRLADDVRHARLCSGQSLKIGIHRSGHADGDAM